MRRICLLLLLIVARAVTAQTTYTACVVEEETGEPLPLVGIYVSQENTTLTNFDGEFSITAEEEDTIRITCIGRKTIYIKAGQLPSVINMRLLEGTLAEVTVQAFDGTMLQISRQMEKAFNRKNRKQAQYFYRQTTFINRQQDIVEAFINARSAVNLRDMRFVSGRHGKLTREKWGESPFWNMNLHHVLELAPMTPDVPFWELLITPLLPRDIQNKAWIISNKASANQKKGKLIIPKCTTST